MRVVSGDRIDWSAPLSAQLVGAVDGPTNASARYVWLHLPRGPRGDALDLVVRPRSSGGWRVPEPGARLEVLAWTLEDEGAAELRRAVDAGRGRSWEEPSGGEVLWVLG